MAENGIKWQGGEKRREGALATLGVLEPLGDGDHSGDKRPKIAIKGEARCHSAKRMSFNVIGEAVAAAAKQTPPPYGHLP